MLVHNEEPRVHVVPVQETDKEGKFLPPKRHISLMPGVNDVPDTDWAKMKALKSIKVWCEEGKLKEFDASPMSKRSPKEAARIVKDTYDKELLMKWREDDKRPVVQDAISAQLKSITPTAEELGKGKKE